MLAVCGLVPASWGGRKSAGVTHSLDPCSGVEVGTHVLGMCTSPCVLIFFYGGRAHLDHLSYTQYPETWLPG